MCHTILFYYCTILPYIEHTKRYTILCGIVSYLCNNKSQDNSAKMIDPAAKYNKGPGCRNGGAASAL